MSDTGGRRVGKVTLGCQACGHEQDAARFCGRCGALFRTPSPDTHDGLDAAAGEGVAHPFDAGRDERSSRVGRHWGRLAAAVGVAILVGVAVAFTGEQPDEPPRTAAPEPDALDEGEQGREEGGTEDEGAVDAVVTSAATRELDEGIYCSWGGSDAEKCDVWAVESDLGPFSHVVAAGERVIVTVEDAVVALHGSDGAVLWTWRGAVPALVAATSDRVFVTGGGRTVALDAATGAQVWETPLREERWLWQSVGDGTVVNREPSSMALFAADDGALLWERSVPSAGGDGTPVIAGDVIVTTAGEELVGYARVDGELLWQVPVTPALPPVHWPGDDVVIVAEDDRVIAVEAASGAQLWTLPTEGVAQLAAIDADTVAVAMPDRVDLVDRHTGTVLAPVHAPALDTITATGDGTFFARAGTSSIRRWQRDPVSTTWNLNARIALDVHYTVTGSASGEQYVVAPLNDGATLAAFEVIEHDGADGGSAPACEGAHPSWHLGRHTAWAGEVVHAAVTDEPQAQLWIGIPGQDPATAMFTVSARPLDATGEARFSDASDDWQPELVVDSGGRTAGGFPPHWVVEAEFPQPGCWEIRIVGDQLDDTVIIPIPAATVVND